MERAGDLLGVALRSMQDPSVVSAWLQARWPSLIGNTMAAHLRPISCARGVLKVNADSREWKNQAEAMKQELRERVNQSWGRTLVREILVELTHERKRLPYEVDNHHLPFLRQGARPKR
ncbi:MAG TPA: DciA family protein [Candidatus Acidoferrales bacterium]|nr:DciA family protein [Candidatus Acidoferrales bacterium]